MTNAPEMKDKPLQAAATVQSRLEGEPAGGALPSVKKMAILIRQVKEILRSFRLSQSHGG